MKLNPDCIRDILLSIEEVTDGESYFEYERYGEVSDRLKQYSHSDIHYHFQQCNMSGLIVGFRRYDGGNLITVADLSPAGHEFLSNIRNNSFWERVKAIAVKVGTPAMGAMLQIAENLATELISGYFSTK